MTFCLHIGAMHHCLSSPVNMHIHKAIIVFRVFQKGWVRLIPFVRSEVLTAVLLKVHVFWDVTLYCWVSGSLLLPTH